MNETDRRETFINGVIKASDRAKLISNNNDAHIEYVCDEYDKHYNKTYETTELWYVLGMLSYFHVYDEIDVGGIYE